MIDWPQLGEILLVLFSASILGGVLGLERELNDHWAGLRTHMLVSLGAAVFIFVAAKVTVKSTAPEEITRVIQGVAAGIGFIGAGTILKLSDKVQVKGLTTAASIWLASAVGVTCGLRMYQLAISTTLATLLILRGIKSLECYTEIRNNNEDKQGDSETE